MEDNSMLEKMARLLQLQKEVAELEKGPKPRTSGIKKKNSQFHMPMNASGKALIKLSELSPEQIAQFKAKNLRKRAIDMRATAEWNLKEAAKLEAEAEALWSKTQPNEFEEELENVRTFSDEEINERTPK